MTTHKPLTPEELAPLWEKLEVFTKYAPDLSVAFSAQKLRAATGAKNGTAKLNKTIVRCIRGSRSISGSEWARVLNVSDTTISKIRRGQSWR